MSKYVFGVDIGGTTVKMGYFTEEGELIDSWEIPTRKEDNGKNVLPDIAASIEEKLVKENITKEDVLGVGLCAPGPVDDDGVIYKAVNLGWGVMNVKEEMENICKMPVMVGNDANVAALGEMWKGGGRGAKDLVVVTLGTGVGGGVIVNGKIVNGNKGAGGEIGHIHIKDDETLVCGCGNKGCLEQYASATGIARLARNRLAEDDIPSVLRDIPEDKVDAKAVFDAVKAGDAVAMEIANKFGKYLGRGLAGIASVTNPEMFVIGGGVSKAGDVLFEYIEKYFNHFAFHGCRDTKFVLATLGNAAGIYGAAKLVVDGVSK